MMNSERDTRTIKKRGYVNTRTEPKESDLTPQGENIKCNATIESVNSVY